LLALRDPLLCERSCCLATGVAFFGLFFRPGAVWSSVLREIVLCGLFSHAGATCYQHRKHRGKERGCDEGLSWACGCRDGGIEAHRRGGPLAAPSRTAWRPATGGRRTGSLCAGADYWGG
jgi:hypothetical protein